MRLLLAHGADPKIALTVNNVTALQVAAGIGWVEGNTYEWSEKANVEAVKLLLDLGVDPEHSGRDRDARRCTGPGTRAGPPSFRCSWITAPDSTRATTG